MSEPVRSHIHQEKPFASLEEEVYISLCLVAQMIERPWGRFLRTNAGINSGQYNILRILRGAGLAGMTVGEVSLRMISRDPDVGGMIEVLMARQLVARKRTSSHRRLANISITQSGLEMLADLDEAARKMPVSMLGHLDDESLHRLDELLGSVLEGDLHFP